VFGAGVEKGLVENAGRGGTAGQFMVKMGSA